MLYVPVSGGRDEVEAAMDSVIVGSRLPVHLRLGVQVFFILVINE